VKALFSAGEREGPRRPVYESDEDRELERDSFRRMQEKWGGTILQFPKGSVLDGIWTDAEHHPRAVLEHKGRYDQYATMWLSCRKYTALMMAADFFLVKPIWVVRFPTPAELHWINVCELNDRVVTMGGRDDRGATSDHEPVIWVPLSKMHKLQL
jgi:hypothetical protein